MARWAPCHVLWDRRRISAACRWDETPRRRASVAGVASAVAYPGRTSDSTAAAVASAAAYHDALIYPRTWVAGAGARRPVVIWAPSEDPYLAGSFLRGFCPGQLNGVPFSDDRRGCLTPSRRSLHNLFAKIASNRPTRGYETAPRDTRANPNRREVGRVPRRSACESSRVNRIANRSDANTTYARHALLPRDTTREVGKIPR